MKPLFSLCLMLAMLAMACQKDPKTNPTPSPDNFDASININTSETYQTIQGFGCATVFQPPNTAVYNSAEFDRLFGSGTGQVGLNILRIRIAPDDGWRATELAYAKQAIQRGAKILATPWSPPANMKTNGSLVGGSLLPDSSAAFARYLNAFGNYMAAKGANLYAISVQNEPNFNAGYEGCTYTAEQMRDFLKNHGSLITSAKLMAPECFDNNQSYVNTILADPDALNNLDIVGGHIYGSGIVENQVAKNKGKEVWMTEHLDTSTTYLANLTTGVEIHNCLTQANFSAYIWWYGKRFYGPIGQDGQVTKRGYVISHFARFVKPGSVRLGTSANSKADVLISAFQNNNKKVIIAINNGTVAVKQRIVLKDGSTSKFVPYTTTNQKNLEAGNAISSTADGLLVTLPLFSITTLVEQ